MWQFKSVAPWAHRLAIRSLFLAGTTTLLVTLAFMPAAAQVSVGIGIGVQPVCSYGYYSYAPYGCAPSGFYGPGYFYNGIFLGVGPWAHWGYGHGWGEHRFNGARGGRYNGARYVGTRGNAGHAYAANRRGPSQARARQNGGGHAAAQHSGGQHGGEHRQR